MNEPTTTTEAAELVVIVPCSGEKNITEGLTTAGALYAGTFHRFARQHAERLGADRVLILSALHGLIPLDELMVGSGYDSKMPARGWAKPEEKWRRGRPDGMGASMPRWYARPAIGATVVVAPSRSLSYRAKYLGEKLVSRRDVPGTSISMAEVLAEGALEPHCVFFPQIVLQVATDAR